jgi:ribosomal protein L11 methyltransferase
MLPPMLVGRRFFLLPEWRDDPPPEGRFCIIVNPGMAFGTGFHETTQLCLEALEDYVRPGERVLDVGTGSGILGEAAGLLGATAVYACDTDPVALEVARRKLGCAFVGSADAVRASVADIVVANISPQAIATLAQDLLRVRKPGGTAILSGFETHEVEGLRALLPPVRDVRSRNTWALIVV